MDNRPRWCSNHIHLKCVEKLNSLFTVTFESQIRSNITSTKFITLFRKFDNFCFHPHFADKCRWNTKDSILHMHYIRK